MTYEYKPKCRNCGKAGSKYCAYTEEPYNGNQIDLKSTNIKFLANFTPMFGRNLQA